MKNKYFRILLLIFFISLAFRLYLSFQTSYFNGDESYFNIRLIDHIRATGKPLIFDILSYGGRQIIVPQLFHYILTLFSFIPFYLKILPAIFSSLIVFVVYFLSKEITNDEHASLLTAFLSGFIPIYVTNILNRVSVYTLLVPVIFFLFYCLLKIDQKKYLKWFLILSFLLPFISPVSFLFVLGLIFYVILMITESWKLSKLKKETFLFVFFLILFINFLLFKRAFLLYGINVIWENIPKDLLYNYFMDFNLFTAIYLIGILQLVLGTIGIFYGFFKEKKEAIILVTGVILSTLFLLILKLVNLELGIIFLSTGLTVISSLTLSKFLKYVRITKFHKIKNYFITFIILLIVVFSLVPSFNLVNNEKPNFEDLEWMKYNTNYDAVILAPLEYGHLITGVSGRRNVIDGNFLLANNPEERLKDVDIIYKTWLETKALELIREYDIDYIYITEDMNDLIYAEDEKCFNEVRERIYKVIC